MVAISGMVGIGCGGSKSISSLTTAELFEIGKEKYDDGKYFKALSYFQAIVYNYPGESIVDTAQYYLALSYYGNKDYELAQVEFNRLVINYPASVYFENAMLFRAICAFESSPGNYALDQVGLAQAIGLFEDFIIDFPESELQEDAHKYLNVARDKLARKYFNSAVTYTRMGAYKASQIYYQMVIDDFTDSEFAPDALFGLAEADLKDGQFDEACRRFDNFVTMYPDHKLVARATELAVESAFKKGEAAYERGEYESARTIFRELIERFRHTDRERFRRAYECLDKVNQAANEESQVENDDTGARGELGHPRRGI